jgi:formiminotetrahydrofolate cyclodeaminase
VAKRKSKRPKRDEPLKVRLDLQLVIDDDAAADLFRRIMRASAIQEARDEQRKERGDEEPPIRRRSD